MLFEFSNSADMALVISPNIEFVLASINCLKNKESPS